MLDETYLPYGAMAPPANPNQIQLGAFQARSLVAGPGQRAVLWVAGCLRRCPQCMKPDLFSFTVGKTVSVDMLAERILSIPDLHGVTYSGGEPFEQAEPLAALSRRLRPSGLSVLAYSGYRIEALQSDLGRFHSLLEQLDILIDGEYRHDLPGPTQWRGSINQRLHLLSDRARDFESSNEWIREIQVSVADNTLRLSGFPNPEFEHNLAASLSARGILLREKRVSEETQ